MPYAVSGVIEKAYYVIRSKIAKRDIIRRRMIKDPPKTGALLRFPIASVSFAFGLSAYPSPKEHKRMIKRFALAYVVRCSGTVIKPMRRYPPSRVPSPYAHDVAPLCIARCVEHSGEPPPHACYSVGVRQP